MRNRHAPQRSCVMCGAKTDKRDLFRIVLTPDQSCVVDQTGKRPGRGAYLCRRYECWRRALQGKRLAAALRGEIDAGDRERLRAFARETLAASPSGAASQPAAQQAAQQEG